MAMLTRRTEFMNQQYEPNWREYIVTIFLLIINIIVFILCSQTGDLVYNIGSMDAQSIFEYHEFYRLLTAIFIHGDIEHIVSNMIFLVGLGQMVECAIGHVRFTVLYLLSGLGASIFSMLYSAVSGKYYSSVGASGAIFGLMGALFILVIVHNGRYGQVSIRRLLFGVFYMVYSGVRTENVDNAAHIGGLICGIFVMAVINVIETHRGGQRI
jgi:rhomboid protease GluP